MDEAPGPSRLRRLAQAAAILVPALLVPVEVVRLARRSSEGPFGQGLAIASVAMLGGLMALGYAGVALWRLRTKKPVRLWFLAGALALSPAAYFFLWNAFFRAQP